MFFRSFKIFFKKVILFNLRTPLQHSSFFFTKYLN